MKNILLVCACLLALVAPLRAAVAPPTDIILVQIAYGGRTTTAIITRGEGKSEKVEFTSGFSDKTQIQSSEAYYKLMHQLYQEGYILQNSFGSNGLFTLLFVKAP